jgi:hypothetical protein
VWHVDHAHRCVAATHAAIPHAAIFGAATGLDELTDVANHQARAVRSLAAQDRVVKDAEQSVAPVLPRHSFECQACLL